MLCDDEIEEFLVAFTVEKGKKKRACIKQTLFLIERNPCGLQQQACTNETISCHAFCTMSVCFLTIHNSQVPFTIAISYPFYLILGAKQPVKPCLLAIRTCSKQKYRHLTTRWRYIDFEIFVCFYFLV